MTAVKDAIEDYQRAKSDRAKNDAEYLVWRRHGDGVSGEWQKEYSKDILVGDFIRIEENGRVPADILLISSGLDKGSHVFIDTKDLDGGQSIQQQQQRTATNKSANSDANLN